MPWPYLWLSSHLDNARPLNLGHHPWAWRVFWNWMSTGSLEVNLGVFMGWGMTQACIQPKPGTSHKCHAQARLFSRSGRAKTFRPDLTLQTHACIWPKPKLDTSRKCQAQARSFLRSGQSGLKRPFISRMRPFLFRLGRVEIWPFITWSKLGP